MEERNLQILQFGMKVCGFNYSPMCDVTVGLENERGEGLSIEIPYDAKGIDKIALGKDAEITIKPIDVTDDVDSFWKVRDIYKDKYNKYQVEFIKFERKEESITDKIQDGYTKSDCERPVSKIKVNNSVFEYYDRRTSSIRFEDILLTPEQIDLLNIGACFNINASIKGCV